jgi:hypothetical protein
LARALWFIRSRPCEFKRFSPRLIGEVTLPGESRANAFADARTLRAMDCGQE